MSRTLRFHGILVAAVLSLTGFALHAEQPAAQQASTVQAAGGDGLIWD
ncbi:hypothetical protein IAG44_17690 [Streptomyces roseirectus]|uniref:Uncharacterized protein n=1 Tax=Streptomyces roseirectus TaxID=2768066 RepID=A0A7H0IE73_9ACTN|nr:hypothetical protein [Streptomyces roseirectus]QNP71089.1 hypothetical protein IAG44_17690 [Streptomyces roseirectus]